MQIRVVVPPALVASLDPSALRSRLGTAMRESLLYVQRKLVANTPFKTGALRASEGIALTGPLAGEVRSGLHYAAAVEFGTRPHVITPSRRKALHWPGAAHPVRRVNHPGTRGARMFARTAESEARAVVGIFERHLVA